MKTAVVTGSTKGIGKAIGEKLLSEGYFVLFNYSSSESDALALRAELEECGYRHFEMIRWDLSKVENARPFAAECLRHIGHVDCLVLNAGVTERTPFEEITCEQWQNVLDTNLNVPFFLIQAFSDAISANGRIILIGAVMGLYPHAVSIPYGVSKAGLHFLAKSLVKFFAPRQITVNVIAPGFVETPWQKTKAPDHRKRVEDKIALHRFAQPQEIADMVWATVQNQYINGAIINIDGGYDYQ